MDAEETKKYKSLLVNLRSKFGFEEDELSTTYPDLASLTKFSEEASALRSKVSSKTKDEDAIGWDAVDDTPVDDEITRVVKLVEQKKDRELSASLAKAPAQAKVSKAEVKSAMSDIQALLSDEDEDSTDD